jgi:hypothetical protein
VELMEKKKRCEILMIVMGKEKVAFNRSLECCEERNYDDLYRQIKRGQKDNL